MTRRGGRAISAAGAGVGVPGADPGDERVESGLELVGIDATAGQECGQGVEREHHRFR